MNCKKISIVMMILIMIAVMTLPVQADQAGPEELHISVPFYTPGMGIMEYEFPYSDSYFLGPGDEFSRDIARASMGLTVSAFREQANTDLENQYETYLKEAGFQKIHTFGYDQPTAVDSLSGVIAYKKIGDFTLIAAAPAGQGYVKEWAGNLELGTQERHEGFQKAAQIMEREIAGYIDEEHLEGNLKLWITGFSRAAAVGNLTAADEIAGGAFSDVYAYLYATPRTTTKPAAYPGIFNIIGKYDPVPQVPLQSWGYERYGTDLYLPAAETDVNYYALRMEAMDVCMEIADDLHRFNPELNYQIKLIMEFLGEMFPAGEEYAEKMQEKVMEIWQEADPEHIGEILITVFSQLEELDARQQYSSKIFTEYIQYLVSQHIGDHRRSLKFRDLIWADDQSMAANLLREHMPYIYMSWIFSDLSDRELFSGPLKTRRLSILGNVDVEVWMGDVFLDGRTGSGEMIFYPELAEKYSDEDFFNSVFIVRNGEETLTCLPLEQDFRVKIRTEKGTDIIYYDVIDSVQDTYGTGTAISAAVISDGEYILEFPYEGDAPELMTETGTVIQQTSQPFLYSPAMIMGIESGADQHVNLETVWFAIVLSFLFIIVLLLVCIVIAVIHAVRKKKHGPYSPLYVIIPHLLLLVLFVIITREVTRDFFLVTIARVAAAAASMLILFLLSLRGLLRNRNLPNLIITAGILGLGFVNCLIYQKSSLVSVYTDSFVIYCVILAVLFAAAGLTFRIGRKKKNLEG